MEKDKELKTPTTIVIFGVTGDLSQRKLMPALIDLGIKGLLPKQYRVVGFSRREWTDQDFKDFVAQAIQGDKHRHKPKEIDKFLRNVVYQQGQFDNVNSYKKLGEGLAIIDREFHYCANKLFYLAVPPALYGPIFEKLIRSGLAAKCGNGEWTRVVVEKPFGRDINTAHKLDQKLGRLFKEEQIFRIDHYLAKETIQNILMFRFSNALFEPIWNNRYVDRVEIKLSEAIGINGRGNFYHDVGALRDVGQNHLLQMLAVIAMDEPGRPDSKIIREQRSRVLQDLKPIRPADLTRQVVRGQYQGFTKEKGIPKDSQTETYFKVKAYVNNNRWHGVPFYLESGKQLKETKTEINVYFKKTICSICPVGIHQDFENVLTFKIQPNEGIALKFWAKRPGFTLELEPKDLAFSYKDDFQPIKNSYEQVLYDCIRGDQMRFLSTAEVDAAWDFITPIINHWRKTKLYQYRPGSWGPKIEDF